MLQRRSALHPRSDALTVGSSASASCAVDLPPSSASEKVLHCSRSSGLLNWNSRRELSPKGPRRTATTGQGGHLSGDAVVGARRRSKGLMACRSRKNTDI